MNNKKNKVIAFDGDVLSFKATEPKQHPINQYEKMVDEQQLMIDIPNDEFQTFQKELVQDLEQLKSKPRTKTTKKYFHFYFDTNVYEQLKKEAKKQNLSASALISNICIDYLSKKGE